MWCHGGRAFANHGLLLWKFLAQPAQPPFNAMAITACSNHEELNITASYWDSYPKRT